MVGLLDRGTDRSRPGCRAGPTRPWIAVGNVAYSSSPGVAHLGQRIVRGARPERPVLQEHDRACDHGRRTDLGADRLVGERREHARREGREQRRDEDEHGEPDRGAEVVADPFQGHPRPAHRYSSLARSTALVRAAGQLADRQHDRREHEQRPRARSSGTAASGGTTTTGAGTGGSPVGVSVANGSTR